MVVRTRFRSPSTRVSLWRTAAAALFASATLFVAGPASAQWSTTYIPIAGLPTEDVDMVELVPTPPLQPPTIVYPTEGTIEYIDITTDLVYASVAKPGPNISGVDYVPSPDGTIGVMPVLGALCVFSHGPGPPALLGAYPLPGTPARRDIDVRIVPGLVSPWDAIYATGTEVHRIDLTTGTFFWTTPVPTPIVEAVDPLYVAATGFGFPVVYVATDGFMTEINAITGAIANPGGTPIAFGATVIREVDIRLNPAGSLVYLHANFLLAAFKTGIGGPPGAPGAMVVSTGLSSMGIEGNDIEWDNTGTRLVAITVANMFWFDAATGVLTDVLSFAPYGHQRNQDLITINPGYGGPQYAGYLAQGAFFRYSVPVLPGAVGIASITPLPSPTMDGVDPLTTDAQSIFAPAAFGVIALVPTQGFLSEIDLRTGAIYTLPPMAPGVLRMDVDVRRGGTGGNKNYQPVLGGVIAISGLVANQYTVTVSTGVHVVDATSGSFLGFIPGVVFRGGDEQVTTLLGPAAPPYTTDDPDQDFLTKCWEYKYTMNRWPMWYATSNPLWYPHFMPYGVFGPPALKGWDIWNDWQVLVLNNQTVVLLNRQGILQQTINLPALPIGGLVWDWDNKICKLRLWGQQECVIDLKSVYWTGLATVTFVPYGGVRTEWYPIVDRMNGWEFVVQRGARRIRCHDHVNNGFVTFIDLPARITRPPVFDEQRKTLCAPLANRQVMFFNAHTYRQTLSVASALYYSPILPGQVVADPVFDLYNHYTMVRCYGGNVVVLNNTDGAMVHSTGVLPYWPVGPIQMDCYNKIAKWNAWNGAQFAEYWLDLYPTRWTPPLSPNLRTIVLGPGPFGYPQFDSRGGWEFVRTANTIRYDYLFSPYTTATYLYPGPFVLTGNLFLDRVNQYGLVATTGTRLLWINLFRLTQGLPNATRIITIPAQATQGIHFLTQLHLAVVQMANNQVGIIDMRAGTYYTTIGGVPVFARQIDVQPFTGLVNWTSYSAGTGSNVTVDLGPIRQNPITAPLVQVQTLAAPSNEAANFIPPPPVNAPMVTQLPHQGGDNGNCVHFRMQPGAAPAGVNYQVDNPSARNTANQMDPVSGTTEDDGSSEFAIVGNPGENIRIRLYDPEGNASTDVDIAIQPVVGVGGVRPPSRFSLAMTSANPVTGRAAFHFELPTRSRVDLDIFDMSGRRVASLVSQEREAGAYDEAWDLSTFAGESAPAGVYFAKFRAGSFEETKRLIVAH